MLETGATIVWSTLLYLAVGDFILAVGWVGSTVLFLIFATWVGKRIRVNRGCVPLHVLFLAYTLSLFAGHGMFYSMDKTFAGYLRISTMVATYVMLRNLALPDGSRHGPTIPEG